jgi:hypothetical protein
MQAHASTYKVNVCCSRGSVSTLDQLSHIQSSKCGLNRPAEVNCLDMSPPGLRSHCAQPGIGDQVFDASLPSTRASVLMLPSEATSARLQSIVLGVHCRRDVACKLLQIDVGTQGHRRCLDPQPRQDLGCLLAGL